MADNRTVHKDTMPGAPVLIIDDNQVNLKLIRVLLTAEGFDIRAAADAEEAQEVLKGFRPYVILMDLQLPGIDGLELTRRLREDPATRDIVIVAITAYAMKSDEASALDAGCDGYIAKPVDTRALPGVIARYAQEYLMRTSSASSFEEAPTGGITKPGA